MNSTGNISYVYDALGTRHSKSYYLTGNGGSSGGQYSYIDDLVFHNGSMEHVRFDGGYISFASGGVPQYHYCHA